MGLFDWFKDGIRKATREGFFGGMADITELMSPKPPAQDNQAIEPPVNRIEDLGNGRRKGVKS